MQYQNRWSCHFLIKMSQYTIINEALLCYRGLQKACSIYIREHACLVKTPAEITSFLYGKANITIVPKIVTHIAVSVKIIAKLLFFDYKRKNRTSLLNRLESKYTSFCCILFRKSPIINIISIGLFLC